LGRIAATVPCSAIFSASPSANPGKQRKRKVDGQANNRAIAGFVCSAALMAVPAAASAQTAGCLEAPTAAADRSAEQLCR